MAIYYRPKPITKLIETDQDGYQFLGWLLLIGQIQLGRIVRKQKERLGPDENIYADTSYCWWAFVDFGEGDDEEFGPFVTEHECYDYVCQIWQSVFGRYADPVEVP